MSTDSVLIVSKSSSYGGVERVIWNLINTLKSHGWQFTIATIYESEFTSLLRREGWATFVMPLLGNRLHRFNAPNYSALLKLVEVVNPGLIHAHGFEAASISRLVGAIRRVPVISTIHGITFHLYPSFKRFIYKQFDSLTSHLAAANVAVSKAVAMKLLRQGYRRGKLYVIYNGVCVPSVLPLGQSTSRPIRVGVIARLSPEKGHRVFFEAARKVLTSVQKEVLFVIVGSGPEEKRLKDYVERLGLRDRVIFKGFCLDMASEYANLDIVVLPSTDTDFEGMPMVLLEAMSYGIPVVATSVGGVTEAVNDETGFVVPSRDIDSLANAITVLIQDEEKRRKMGQAGYERIKRFFSVEAMAQAYERLYTVVMK